jgi:hypothetical protein
VVLFLKNRTISTLMHTSPPKLVGGGGILMLLLLLQLLLQMMMPPFLLLVIIVATFKGIPWITWFLTEDQGSVSCMSVIRKYFHPVGSFQ